MPAKDFNQSEDYSAHALSFELDFDRQRIHNEPSADVNQLHLRLMHHFITCTSNTLVFGVEVWRNEIVRLSFEVRCYLSPPSVPNPC